VFCECFLSRIASHVKHSNNQKIIQNAFPLIVRWILYSNSNRKLKLNPDWIHHTNFEIGDLPFIFFLFFSCYSCTHFLQNIISPNCDWENSPKLFRSLDALSISLFFWWLMTIPIWAQKGRIKFKNSKQEIGELPLNMCINISMWPQMSMHIFKWTPPTSLHSSAFVWYKIRDAYDKIITTIKWEITLHQR